MTINPLQTIMAPNSIAIVGASNNLGKMGSMQLLNILCNNFPGNIFPVHPNEKSVLGYTAYRSIKELPETPELAIIVVPSRLIPDMMTDFGEIGTRHVIIMSAGFKETGQEGLMSEKRLLEICKTFDIRFVGPNCMGVLNTHHPFNCTVSPFTGKPGKISMISQSGTYVAQTHLYLKKRGIALGKAISIGNSSNIGLTDCLEYLGEDDDTKAIGIYIESISDGDKFLEIAKKITPVKPIVVQYVGGTKSGALSGLSHTGAMAGPDYIYNGLFEQAGIIRVGTIEEVYCVSHALANQPLPKGNRIGILTNSGGPATAMATTLDMYGIEIPELSSPVRKKIETHIPPHGASRNPVDLTFGSGKSALNEDLPEIMLGSDEIDGLLLHGISDTGWFDTVYPALKPFTKGTLESLRERSARNVDKLLEMPARFSKPVVLSSFFRQEDHAGKKCMENGIPLFNGPEKAAKTMAMLCKYSRIKNRSVNGSVPIPEIPVKAKEVIASVNGPMDEFSAKEVLRAYGIPTCREELVHSPDDAVKAARDIGFPVALKGCSPDIQHKTEAGIVHLGLQNEKEVADAYEDINNKVGKMPVLVSEMVKGSREVIAGMTRLDGFPPAILFGLGGIFTEALKDNAVRLAPFDQTEAIRQIESIKSANILEAFRGMAPVDKGALADLLIRLGHLSIHFPKIREIDMNPIFIVKGKPVVVDALFVL